MKKPELKWPSALFRSAKHATELQTSCDTWQDARRMESGSASIPIEQSCMESKRTDESAWLAAFALNPLR